MVITPEKFLADLKKLLANKVAIALGSGVQVKSVTGPGRSGAVTSVYASYILGIPFIPYGQKIPDNLYPILIIDTATRTGRSLRKAQRKYDPNGKGTTIPLAVYKEPPRLHFWYENNKTRMEIK